MIPFGGEYTKAQWSRGMRLAIYPQGRGLFLRLLVCAICVASFVIFAVNYFQGNEMDSIRSLRTLFLSLILAVWALSPFWQAWRASREPWQHGRKGPHLKGTIQEEGIVSNANISGEPEKWGNFLRAHVRDDIVVLISQHGTATILPREFFATEADWWGFRQFVEFNVVEPL